MHWSAQTPPPTHPPSSSHSPSAKLPAQPFSKDPGNSLLPMSSMQNYRVVASLNVSGSRTMVENRCDLQFLLAGLDADLAFWILQEQARRLLLSQGPPS